MGKKIGDKFDQSIADGSPPTTIDRDFRSDGRSTGGCDGKTTIAVRFERKSFAGVKQRRGNRHPSTRNRCSSLRIVR